MPKDEGGRKEEHKYAEPVFKAKLTLWSKHSYQLGSTAGFLKYEELTSNKELNGKGDTKLAEECFRHFLQWFNKELGSDRYTFRHDEGQSILLRSEISRVTIKIVPEFPLSKSRAS